MKLFAIVLILVATKALAYPNYIGHGYTSCSNCHFNPFGGGGGPLTDYGRVVSATTIASKMFYSDKADDEIAYLSGFFFHTPKNKHFRFQSNYRGIQVVRNPESSKAEDKQWINMVGDVRALTKFGENDKFVMAFQYGITPKPQNPPQGRPEESFRSREWYFGYRPTKGFGVYAGLLDKVYGVRIVEHIAFSRQVTQTSMNDQVHGVAAHFLQGLWEGGLHAFVGNLDQRADLRTKGASAQVEKTIFNTHRIGASVQSTKNDYQKLISYSAHTRLNLKHGSALLAELGQSRRSTQNGRDEGTSRYALLQTYLRPTRGLYFLQNIEYLNRNITKDEYVVRWGPGVQWWPMMNTEFRFDLYNTRNFSPKSSTQDSWMYGLQTNIWF